MEGFGCLSLLSLHLGMALLLCNSHVMATVRKETYKIILSFRFDDLEKGPTPEILLSTWTASMEFFIKVKEGFDIATR